MAQVLAMKRCGVFLAFVLASAVAMADPVDDLVVDEMWRQQVPGLTLANQVGSARR